MHSHSDEPSIAIPAGQTFAKKMAVRSRILFLGILAGFLPLIIIGLTVSMVSLSLQKEIAQSLADVRAQEGKRLAILQRSLIHSQMRQKALDVAREVVKFIKAHPHQGLAALLQDPAFRKIAVQPVGLLGETFLLEVDSQKILLHDHYNLAGQTLENILPSEAKFLRDNASGQGIYGLPDSSKEEGPRDTHHVFVAVAHRFPGGQRLLVGRRPSIASWPMCSVRPKQFFARL